MLDKIFRSNHFARVLALFLAIMLWLFVEGGEIAQPAMVRQTFEEVPLVTLDLEEGYTVEEMPSSVEVTLEGTREALNGVGARDLVAFVDLQGKSPGTYQLPVVVQPPPQVEVVSHNPEAVEITVEELESRDFPLQVALLGRDPVREVDTQIDPEKISIQGATSVLEQVETVMVYADVRGLNDQESKSMVVEPQPLDENREPVEVRNLSPSEVEMTLQLEEPEDDHAMEGSFD